MLIRFKFQNVRSFSEEQEFSLVASRSLKDMPDVIRPGWGDEDGVLPVAAIYGANASGKTNVMKALSFMKSAVVGSQRHWKPDAAIDIDPFALDEQSRNKPSTFEVDVVLRGTRLQYGFALDASIIQREWLYAYPSNRKQTWFTRDASAKIPFRFGKSLVGENRTIENLTRPNSLFLSAAAQNNHEQLSGLYVWFSQALHFVTADRTALLQRTLEGCKVDAVRTRISSMLSAADLGIVGMDVTEQTLDETTREITESIYEIFKKRFDEKDTPRFPTSLPKATFRHRASHDPSGISFPLNQESAGTVSWVAMLGPIISTLGSGGTLCVDELDASLHPLLAAETVRLFNDALTNPKNAQLVFNTHDTNLLDPKLLRRDQVWFVEKDREGGSHLYPLTDFKPRREENLERGYLQGRYGAIPFLGAIEKLTTLEDL